MISSGNLLIRDFDEPAGDKALRDASDTIWIVDCEIG